MPYFYLKMALKNGFRHRLRATLTIVGIVIAILAFGLLRTIVNAWYAGADAASESRLVTRNSISLVFTLPISYKEKIRQVDGIKGLSWANWFGGVYIDERNFFPQFAVDAASYMPLYPEYLFDEAEHKAFLLDKRGAAVGRKLATRYGWKVGDTVPLKGTIFPGTYQFVVRAIFDGKNKNTDTNVFFFHWQLLNDRMEQLYPGRANRIGVFIIGLSDPARAAQVSQTVDREFHNSLAETLTETEKAFQLGFVAMTEAIVVAIEIVAYVVILIIMAVMANTMAMAARERTAEYATLKALGFAPGVVGTLIFIESMLLAAIGGAIGIALTFPVARVFASALDNIFPIFNISQQTIMLQILSAAVVGLAAAIIPAIRSSKVRIVEGLRNIG